MKLNSIYRLFYFIILILIFGSCAIHQTHTPYSKYYNAKKSVFSIRLKNKFLGSAFTAKIKHEKDYYFFVLTAGHVVSDYLKKPNQLELLFGNLSFPIDNIYLPNILDDLAIIQSQKLYEYATSSPNIITINKLSKYKKNIDFKNIFTIHNSIFDDIQGGILSKGHIISLNKESMVLYAPSINPGGSGAPIFLSNTGKVIGMLTSIKIDKKSNSYTDIAYGINASEIITSINNFSSSEINIFRYPITTGFWGKYFSWPFN